MANAWNTTELSDSQVGKVASVNLAVKFLQSFLTGVRDIATSVPGSPVENGMYIAGSGSISGAWAAYTVNDLCFYFGAAWYKVTPIEGMRVRVWDEDIFYVYTGSAWAMEPQEVGDMLLARVTTAHMQTSDGAQTLYTVPTGKKMVPTRVVVRNPTASLAGATDVNFGDGTNRDTWKPNVDLSGMTATSDVMVITNDNAKFTPFDAGDTFGFKPDTGSTADADATMEVFGYLY
jgi:hypothetical protein